MGKSFHFITSTRIWWDHFGGLWFLRSDWRNLKVPITCPENGAAPDNSSVRGCCSDRTEHSCLLSLTKDKTEHNGLNLVPVCSCKSRVTPLGDTYFPACLFTQEQILVWCHYPSHRSCGQFTMTGIFSFVHAWMSMQGITICWVAQWEALSENFLVLFQQSTMSLCNSCFHTIFHCRTSVIINLLE